jgi:DNA polymerase III delta subunit
MTELFCPSKSEDISIINGVKKYFHLFLRKLQKKPSGQEYKIWTQILKNWNTAA